MPGVYRRSIREIVEIQILLRQKFCEQNYLAGVHREMFHHVEDSCQGGYVAVLDLIRIEKFFVIEPGQDVINFRERVSQSGQKCFPGYQRALVEFGLAEPVIVRATQAAYNPLARVAREMQEQIANTV